MFPLSIATLLTLVLIHRADSVKLRCPRDVTVFADKRTASATVTWDSNDFHFQSNHPLKSLYQIIPIKGASASVKKEFTDGLHYIEYKAVDTSGHVASCAFTVTVVVVHCSVLHNPLFGVLSCDFANLYGSRCSVSCLPGYLATGRDTECTEQGYWSEETPFCRSTRCSDPGTPFHGSRDCTTPTHAYGSSCSFTCRHGYQLIGPSRISCQSVGGDTLWSDHAPFCQEIIPPEVESCPTSVLQISTSEQLVQVEKPPVIFRTSSGAEAPQKCSHFQERSSQNFSVGLHVITCTAFDPAFGETVTSKCEFLIRVKVNPCRALSQPLFGFLLCSHFHGGDELSREAVRCRLFCDKGYTLPRSYNDHHTFMCDRSGVWTPSEFVPSCVVPSRPQELKLPSELQYFSTNCSDANSLTEVRTQFQAALSTVIRLHESCSMNPKECIIDDVTTACRERDSSPRSRGLRADAKLRRHRRGFLDVEELSDAARHIADVARSQTLGDKSVSSSSTRSPWRSRRKAKLESKPSHAVPTTHYSDNSTDTLHSRNSSNTTKQYYVTNGNKDLALTTQRYDATSSQEVTSSAVEDTTHMQESDAPRRLTKMVRRQEPAARRRQFHLSIQFHFATRLPLSGGEWPDEYHRAAQKLFSLFDFFEQNIVAETFNFSAKVRSLNVREVVDSLTFAPLKTICDLGYEFNVDILLCVPCGPGTYFDNSRDRCVPCPDGLSQPRQGQFQCN